MSKELRYIIEQISVEKGLSKDTLMETLETAMLSAIKKRYSDPENLGITINTNNYDFEAYRDKTVVDVVENPNLQISLLEAQSIDENFKLEETARVPIEIKDFGRIAVQTAKQAILQKVREAERDMIFEEFSHKIGSIVSGTVNRKERGVYVINIGKAELFLPQKETIIGEHLKIGSTVRALIDSVSHTSKGPQIILSRVKPEFVVELFRLEVPEIHDGTVVVKKAVREAGERTKIAVASNEPSIDPVGACVGMKGSRVQSIVRELRGERIDIINWSDDPRVLLSRALTPATVDKIGINEDDNVALAIVEDSQLSVAIGKKGINVRLAMKL
ncbi:MAG: transcription termination factor NusA, partial [Nitrospirae bacterium]|nr:transcription termination factor NusA [Nitrospirota bacterium]